MDREQKDRRYEEVNITELFTIIFKRKKLVFVYVATIVLISYLVNYHLLRPTYEAKATLMVISSEEKNTRVATNNLEGLVKNLTTLPEMNLNTYVGQLKNEKLLMGIYKDLNLEAGEYTLGDLKEMVSIEIIKDTNLVEIKARNTSPELAATIANRLAVEYLSFISHAYKVRLEEAKNVIQVQIKTLEEDIKNAHKDLNNFRNQPPTIDNLQEQLNLEMDRRRANSLDLESSEVGVLRAKLADKQSEENRMIGEVQRLESIHKFLLEQSIQAELLGSLEIGKANITTISEASEPLVPVKPRKELNLAISTGLAILTGFMLALIAEFYNRRVVSEDQVNKILGYTVLGRIPKMNLRSGIAGKGGDLLTSDPRSIVVGEAFRILRTNIYFLEKERKMRRYMVTSTGPGEGKSTLIANLAVTMAQTGKKVLIIDTDLRRPMLNKIFGANKQPGLTEFLQQEIDLEDIVSKTSYENLEIITSGSLANNPSELLSSTKFEELLNSLNGYDIVLLDCPPIMTVTDPILVADKVDGVLFVVGLKKVKISMVERTKQQLKKVNASIVGVALNLVELEGEEYRYYSYYSCESEA